MDPAVARGWPGGLGRASVGSPHHPVVAALSLVFLAQVAKRVSPGKAPGADGWAFAYLRTWPPFLFSTLFSTLAEFFSVVEAVGRWPSSLSSNMVALLPRGFPSAAGPAEIVLLSVAHRLRAACRTGETQRWLRCGRIVQLGSAANPEAKAGALALALSRTSGCLDSQLSGLSVTTICHDLCCGKWHNVPGFRRRSMSLVSSGWAEKGKECRGANPWLGAKCFAATDWLAMVMACWGGTYVRLRRARLPSCNSVDDLVAYGRNWGATAVADVWEATRCFGGVFGLVLNATKSVRCSSSAEVRAELRLMRGPPVGMAFKDGGLDQHSGNSAPSFCA